MRILAFGTYDVRTHPRMGVLIEGLRAHGDEVVEVNVPLGIDTAARVAMLKQPWRVPSLALRLARCWTMLSVRGWRTARAQRPDTVLVGYLGHFDVRLARRLFPRATIVLDHLLFAADTARDRGQREGWKTWALERVDRTALASADVVVVDTEEHAALVPRHLAERALVVPVGATSVWFDSAHAKHDDDGALRVVFFGLFTPLQGATVIGRALAQLADEPAIETLLIGTGQDHAETATAAAVNPKVRWCDWVPAAELPALVATHDVCLGIFGSGPKARRVVPNKVYQGAAAGCAVVTSDTAPQRLALGEAGACYVPPGDATALASALRRLAANRTELVRLRKAGRAQAETSFSPSKVVVPLRDRLTAVRPVATAPPPPGLPPNARLRFDVVGRRLAELQPGTVLELGCGQGAVGARLAAIARQRYLGVEPDAASFAVAAARVRAAGGEVLHGDASSVPEGARFDLVCAFEVLEHLEDEEGVLSSWSRLVRPGGHLMVSVPAAPERFGAWDEHVGHLRRYSPERLEEVLRGAGLVEPRLELYGWPLGYALEAVRNRVAKRRSQTIASSSAGERTAGSGRVLQPGRLAAAVAGVSTWPFIRLQRRAPGRGTGLVAVARRP